MVGKSSFRSILVTVIAGVFTLVLVGCDSGSSSDSGSGDGRKDTIDVKPKPDPKPDPKPEPKPKAKSIDDTCILWKPISEGNGRLVVLLPSNYGSPTVYVQKANGDRIEKGNYVGRTNGSRATYRFSRTGRGYPDPSYLSVGGSLYQVKRPGSRHSC